MIWFCWLFLVHDLQQALGRFVAKCEAIRMTVSFSKSDAMVLCWKMVDCPLQLGGELLPQAKYLWVLVMNDEKMVSEMGRRFGTASAVLHQTIVVSSAGKVHFLHELVQSSVHKF